MRGELCGAEADQATGVADGQLERPRLTAKRLVIKEDGRYLIFYEFDESKQQTEGQP